MVQYFYTDSLLVISWNLSLTKGTSILSQQKMWHLKLCFVFLGKWKQRLSLSWWRGLARLPGHTGSVNEVCFHPKEPIIASVASDRTGALRRTLLRSCWANPTNWRTDFCQNQEVLFDRGTPFDVSKQRKKQILNSSYDIMDQHNYGPNDFAVPGWSSWASWETELCWPLQYLDAWGCAKGSLVVFVFSAAELQKKWRELVYSSRIFVLVSGL